MSETHFVLLEGNKEKVVLHQGPFELTKTGIKFSPEFEREVQIDSIILDWSNTVENANVFGQNYKFQGAEFNPLFSLIRVFGMERHKTDPQQTRLVEILSSSDPRILLIHGHGVQQGDKWLISLQGDFGQEIVDMEDFLKDPVKKEVGTKAYDLIVLDVCSAGANGVGTYQIPQAVIDEVGVPIYYVKGISGMLVKSDRVLAEPKRVATSPPVQPVTMEKSQISLKDYSADPLQ